MHWFITLIKCEFSSAAATLSLSANCLFTLFSDVCVPGLTSTFTLNLGGSERNNLTLIDNPISVAILQWGIVGVNKTSTLLFLLSTVIKSSCRTCNSSSVNGCSGSLILRIKSEIKYKVYKGFVIINAFFNSRLLYNETYYR